MSETTIIKNDECTVEEKYQELGSFIRDNQEKRGYLIPVLYKAQSLFGYLPSEVQKFVAEEMNISVSEVFGVVTFYSYFKTQPVGRHTITICMGTACYVRGAKKILEALENKLGIKIGETTEDLRFTLGEQRCFGSCGMAPVIMIDNEVHGRLTPSKLDAILEKYK
ncbi:MAG: NADH-quinone oxidoreductase subunit NuoE [Atribacterota bacterium]|jgi:NADH-quinone oxidoreductase E subunit|nr:NADH-quinone oxidoreductase subunit NuoE [Atribacterota bacterium]MDD4895299.1 NADH-quinone oxidoreductase subunit NuoE [Atribacterota bacterium]MDD5636623.1 NADH-quinone oxidoreductase subunit NuoE [Atribacterota bacterium]